MDCNQECLSSVVLHYATVKAGICKVFGVAWRQRDSLLHSNLLALIVCFLWCGDVKVSLPYGWRRPDKAVIHASDNANNGANALAILECRVNRLTAFVCAALRVRVFHCHECVFRGKSCKEITNANNVDIVAKTVNVVEGDGVPCVGVDSPKAARFTGVDSDDYQNTCLLRISASISRSKTVFMESPVLAISC